ncbi:hypothetical protein ACJW8F_13155 [Plesiomonas shigelloides]|uniref:hypothetical protein n=1 Tax=Plesiomonas shigelloides TaxID=703 RepID=UPI00387EF07E
MQNVITLKLTDKEITLNTHCINDAKLFKAQDLLKGYGYDSKKSSNTLSNFLISMKNKSLDFQVVSFSGRSGGTYLTKRQILKLAGFVSYEFEDAVYEAFEALSEGRISDAIAVADAVITSEKVHELMIAKSHGHTIRRMFNEAKLPLDKFTDEILSCSNYNSACQLKERIKFSNALKRFVNNYFAELKGEAACEAHAAYKTALLSIEKYQKRRLTQVKTRKVNKGEQKVERVRNTAFEIYKIGKRLENEVRVLKSALRNPF